MMKHIAAVLPDIMKKEKKSKFVYVLFTFYFVVFESEDKKIPFNFLFLQRPNEVTEKAGVNDPRDNPIK
jgi:hypothetical protein